MLQQAAVNGNAAGLGIRFQQTHNRRGAPFILVMIPGTICPVCQFWNTGNECINPRCPTVTANTLPEKSEEGQ